MRLISELETKFYCIQFDSLMTGVHNYPLVIITSPDPTQFHKIVSVYIFNKHEIISFFNAVLKCLCRELFYFISLIMNLQCYCVDLLSSI